MGHAKWSVLSQILIHEQSHSVPWHLHLLVHRRPYKRAESKMSTCLSFMIVCWFYPIVSSLQGGVVQEKITVEASEPTYAVPDKDNIRDPEGVKQRALSNLVDLEKEVKTIQEVGSRHDYRIVHIVRIKWYNLTHHHIETWTSYNVTGIPQRSS